MSTLKPCPTCHTIKPTEDFRVLHRAGKADASDFQCRLCCNLAQQRRQTMPGAKLKAQQAYALKVAAGWRAKRWADKTPAERAVCMASVKRFRATHSVSCRSLESQSKRIRRHPSRRIIWPLIVAHYGGFCVCCGLLPPVIDHVVPLRADGSSLNDWPNVQPLCRSCNSMKGQMAVSSTDYRPDGGAWIVGLLMERPELSVSSLALFRRPGEAARAAALRAV